MLEHTIDSAGGTRESDNWQKGFPLRVYVKSLLRHSLALWRINRGFMDLGSKFLEDTLCAIIFNAQGYLHVHLKNRIHPDPAQKDGTGREKLEEDSSSDYLSNSGLLPAAFIHFTVRKMDLDRRLSSLEENLPDNVEYRGKCDCDALRDGNSTSNRWKLQCCDFHCFNCSDHAAVYEGRINNPRSAYPFKG